MSMPGGAPPRPDPTGSGRASASRQPVADLRTDGSPARNQLAGRKVLRLLLSRRLRLYGEFKEAALAEPLAESVRLVESMCARLRVQGLRRSIAFRSAVDGGHVRLVVALAGGRGEVVQSCDLLRAQLDSVGCRVFLDAGNAFGAGDWGMSSLAVAIPKLGLDEAAPDRVACEFDAVPHAELLEHVRAVAVDGLDADDEHGRDFF